MVQVKNKVCLMCVSSPWFSCWFIHSLHSVHDGWGIAPEKGMKGDAIEAADTTYMDTLAEKYASRSLFAHGNAVGLNDGLMGNSEVGCVASAVPLILHSS